MLIEFNCIDPFLSDNIHSNHAVFTATTHPLAYSQQPRSVLAIFSVTKAPEAFRSANGSRSWQASINFVIDSRFHQIARRSVIRCQFSEEMRGLLFIGADLVSGCYCLLCRHVGFIKVSRWGLTVTGCLCRPQRAASISMRPGIRESQWPQRLRSRL